MNAYEKALIGSCKTAGEKRKVLNTQYTCIRYGETLIWDKGQKIDRIKQIKPGIKCLKRGAQQIYIDKLYICIKKGKRLIWSNGIINSNSQYDKAIIRDLSKHKSITDDSKFSKISSCKISDITQSSFSVSNGFPRPKSAKTGKQIIKILFVPVSFSDYIFTDQDFEKLKSSAKSTREFYLETSFGKMTMEFEFLPKKDWVTINQSAEEYNLTSVKPQQNNIEFVRYALSIVDESVNFDLYQGVVLETPSSIPSKGGQGFPGYTFKTKNGTATGVSLGIGQVVGDFQVLAHELGHSIFGLEDLYVFLNNERPSVPDPFPAGSWDLMSNSSLEFFGWTKFLNNWISTNQVRCINNQETTIHYLEAISIWSKKPKLVLISLEEGKVIAIEARTEARFSSQSGLLVYKIDTSIAHGDGPIFAQNRLLNRGENISLDGWNIQVKDLDKKGVLFEVNRL